MPIPSGALDVIKNKGNCEKILNFRFQAKYDSMQANIKNMEDAQRIAELESEVSEYKLKVTLTITAHLIYILTLRHTETARSHIHIQNYAPQNEVNATESELLQYHVEESERVQKMSEYIAELQSEVKLLALLNKSSLRAPIMYWFLEKLFSYSQ